jgi:diguanylate cyclase (GGDEF)-like protein
VTTPADSLEESKPKGILPPIPIAAIWLFTLVMAGFICVEGWLDWSRARNVQVSEAQRAVRYTVQDISRQIQEQRRLFSLFVWFHERSLRDLLRNPNSPTANAAVHQAIQRFFPTAFAFTLADAEGKPLIDDFDNLVGDVCRNNIRHFAREGSEQPVYIHPHPEVYHYDLMTRFAGHILFISFRPDEIVSALRENASLGQRLYLTKGMTRLIELGPEGARLKLGRDFHLNSEEEQALLAQAPVSGTEWRVVVLPDLVTMARERNHVLTVVTAELFGILLFTALILWLLRREYQRRLEAEGLAERMSALSNLDPVSGLPNRRALLGASVREWQWMERSGQPLTLMMVEVDFFGMYQKHHGDSAADEALRLIGEALKGVASRPRDMVGRFGAERFLILLPATPRGAGPQLADDMRQAVHDLELAHGGEGGARLTISIGLGSAMPGMTRSASQLLRLADQALHLAKGNGRDSTVILPSEG